MKPRFETRHVDFGGERFACIVRVSPRRAPAHAGADDVRFLDPGAPERVTVMRILQDGVDVTEDLTYFARRAVEKAASK